MWERPGIRVVNIPNPKKAARGVAAMTAARSQLRRPRGNALTPERAPTGGADS
jgi:hypothetical protein